jgi:transposase
MMSALSITPLFRFARMKVTARAVHSGGRGAMVHLEPDGRCRPVCHACGGLAMTVHSKGHRRMVRDLNLADRQVILHVKYRKVWCARCGKAKVEQLSFCHAGQRLTHRLRRYVYELCKLMPISDVARHLDLDPKTVKAIDQEFLEEDFGQTDYGNLVALAIDEVSVGRGQQYLTVVLDYLTGRVVWTGAGHDTGTLDRFFAGMSDSQKQAVQAVTMDMWEAYINRVRHHCPQAMIVFDFFHVVKAYGRVIDEVRRAEVRQACGPAKRVIKGSRYLLLRNRANLSEQQQGRLDELLKLNTSLNAVYVLKEQLKMIYQYQQRPAARQALEEWMASAAQVDNLYMRKFIQMLRDHEEGILNHCRWPIGTSCLEGVNNKIKVIQRRAYGFHDMRYFGLKIKQAFPGPAARAESGNFLG